MADNKVVKITFEIDGIKQSVGSVEELETALKGVETQATETAKNVEKVGDEIEKAAKSTVDAGAAGEATVGLLDKATGGLAGSITSTFKQVQTLGKTLVTSFKSGVAGASSLGKALIATGIGAIVVAVGLLVTYWDDIKGLVNGVGSEQRKLLAETEATVAANQANLDATTASEQTLLAQGMTEKEIRDLKIQQTNEVIAATEAQLEQQKAVKEAQIAAAERNQKIAMGIIAFLASPVTILLGAVDQLTKALAYIGVVEEGTSLAKDFLETTSKFIFDPEEVAAEGDATIEETEKTLRALKNQRDGFTNQAKANAAKDAADAQAKRDEAAAAELETQKALAEQLEDLRAKNIEDAEQQALALLEIERKRARKELEEKGANQELLLEFDRQYEQRKQDIVDEFAARAEEKRLADEAKAAENRAVINDALRQAGLDSMEQTFERAQAELEFQRQADLERLAQAGATADELARIDANYTAKSKKLSKEEADFKKALRQQDVANALNASSQVLGSIVSLVGEGSAIGKAAAVAQTTIDTFSSATAAYSSTVGIPVVGPVLAPIAAGVAVAAGLMNVKKILSTKVPGPDPGGSIPTVPTAPTVPTVPSFDPNAAIAGNVGDAQAPGAVTTGQVGTQTQVVRAYVVDSEVTSQQEATRKIENLASL